MTGQLARVAGWVWGGATPGARVVRAALGPAAGAYGVAVTARNLLYDRGWLRAARVTARVLSVGNLTVGGTGKTPTALWLAEALAARGARVGIVARGYGKRRRGVVVVGVGGGPLVDPEEGGDEAVLLARRFRGPVVTGERRSAAAALAVERFGLDTVVLDDGFQHRALARDADLVLLPEQGPGDRLLPAGPLREPLAGLTRASAVLVVGRGGALPPAPAPPPGIPAFRGRLVPGALVRAVGDEWREESPSSLAGQEVTAVAGVADPEGFVAVLRGLGASVRGLIAFGDHHVYGAADRAGLAAAGPLVTTEKDLVKLGGTPGLEELRALRVTLEVERGAALLERLLGSPGLDLDGD